MAGRLSRRAAALAALSLVLVACPSGPEPGPSLSPSASARAARGEIVVAYPVEPATLDPFTRAGASPATRDLVRLLMPSLYRTGPGFQREPSLLAGEPLIKTGSPFSMVVPLRPDARWSDGTPITVADLRATWKLVTDPDETPFARDGFDQIRRIVAETPTRARIEFKRPFARWRELFSQGLGVVPAHVVRTARGRRSLDRRWGVSGGPFVLTRWREGLDMTFEPNPEWWGPAALVERLRIVFVPDPTGALELFRRGEVDVLGPYAGEDWTRRIDAIAGAQVTVDASGTWAGVVMNTRATALESARVRRALVDAIDRRRVVEGLVQQDGSLLLTPGAGGAAIGAASDRLVRARRLLDAAGWRGSPRTKNGEELTFTLATLQGDDLGTTVANAVKYQAARAGFSIELVPLSPERFWQEWLWGSDFDAAMITWRDGAGMNARARFGPAGVRNIARLADRDLDRRFRAQDRDLLKDETPVDGGVGARLARLAPVVPLYRVQVTLAARAGIVGVQASGGPDGPFWNADRWAA